MMHIADDADDGEPARCAFERAKIDALTEGVAVGPEAARHGFVDVDVRAVPIFLREGRPRKRVTPTVEK